MSHTPGPWVHVSHRIYGPLDPESRHSNGRVLVAQVIRGSRRADPDLFGGAERFSFDSEADANLIAAAPEMYEALNWLTHIEHGIGKSGGKPEPGEREAAIDSAKKALAKACGEAVKS